MIYPTRRAVILVAAGAPFALAVAVAMPQAWFAGLGWAGLVLALAALDATLGPWPGAPRLSIDAPRTASVGGEFAVSARIDFPGAWPRFVQLALGLGPLFTARTDRLTIPIADGAGAGELPVTASRRGTGAIETLWLRWRAPLGLVWKQRIAAPDARIVVTPDISTVREQGAHLFLRDAQHGLLAMLDKGEGMEFEALTEFRPGMDRRAIDWKQSARHNVLLAKEYRTERNNNIAFAIDAGRAMCEPIAGLSRLDRAVSAALLAAFVALKIGDRVSLFGFDARPRLMANPVSGARSFAALQRLAAQLDYSGQETNYTLALATLAGRLHRRSLVVLFTEFADPTSAELMIRAAAKLLDRHLLLFVVLADADLEALAAAEPREPEDVSRAVTAAALLRERRIVTARLRQIGIHVLEAAHDRVGPALVGAYLDLKRRGLL